MSVRGRTPPNFDVSLGLSVERGFDRFRQARGFSFPPIVKEKSARRFAGHVMVNGHNVDAGLAQRFQHGLQFVFVNRKIAINYCVVVAAGKRGPGVDAHFLPDLAAARHLRVSAKDDFEHAVVDLSFDTENAFDDRSGNGTGRRNEWSTELRVGLRRSGANFFNPVESLTDAVGQFFYGSLTPGVHEIDFRLVEKKMVVEGRDA